MQYINIELNPTSKSRLEYFSNNGFKLGRNFGECEVFDKKRAKAFVKTIDTFDGLVSWECIEQFKRLEYVSKANTRIAKEMTDLNSSSFKCDLGV